MSYIIEKVEEIYKVTFAGEVDFEMRLCAGDELCKMIDPARPVCILVDFRRMVDLMSVNEKVKLAEYLTSRKELQNAKFAALVEPRNHSNAITEAISIQKGRRVADFSKEVDALRWLRGDT